MGKISSAKASDPVLPSAFWNAIRQTGCYKVPNKSLFYQAVGLPPMLILDEATSSIDTRTEMKIQNAFATMMKGRTSFIVAHRLSTIQEADIILVMKEGHIIELGVHTSKLTDEPQPVQLNLFDLPKTQKEQKAQQAAKALQDKYGKNIIRKGF